MSDKLNTYLHSVSTSSPWSDPSSKQHREIFSSHAIHVHQLHSRSIAGGVNLRVLPLGDSITYGGGSSDGNSYRLDLQNLLTSGNNLSYIGSVRHGTMANNNNEGHPGYTIDAIGGQAPNSMPERPNVVLLMAGTNDIVLKAADQAGAPTRLGNLIDLVVAGCPDAAILVATLTPLLDPVNEAEVVAYNAAIPGVIASRVNAGKHVMMVDMSEVPASDIHTSDGIHPDDAGYVLIAYAWYAAINKAGSNGWIHAPVSGGSGISLFGGNCSPWSQNTQGVEIACGINQGNAPFIQRWSQEKTVAYSVLENVNGIFPAHGGQFDHGYGETNGDGVRFADLNGDGRDDYLWVAQDGSVRAFLNTGNPNAWTNLSIIATGLGATRETIIFADVNCDGLADFLIVDPDGSVTARFNLGVAHFPNWAPPLMVAYGVGAPGSQVRFADIDGDGCPDYFTLDPVTGAVHAWLNTLDFPQWTSLGLMAAGFGSPGSSIRFADVNGDHRDDYLVVSEDGAVSAYINTRGQDNGLLPTWTGPVTFTPPGVRASREKIRFADLTGDGKTDYLVVKPKTGGLDAFMNEGTGGMQPGDGVRFADVNGDGLADYLWLAEDGAVTGYFNLGPSKFPDWDARGLIAYGVGATRDAVLFADVTCDGLADYLVVDKNGAVTARYNKNDFPNWGDPVLIASGVGAPREAIRFADINGDGCADYLVVDQNGTVTAYMNIGVSKFPSWQSPVVVAQGVGGAREDIHFADLNGDGFADYLVVDRLVGSVHAWFNGGFNPDGQWLWHDQGVVALGVGANGLAITFADVNGDKLSDYLRVTPATGAVVAWYNGCQASANTTGTASTGTSPNGN